MTDKKGLHNAFITFDGETHRVELRDDATYADVELSAKKWFSIDCEITAVITRPRATDKIIDSDPDSLAILILRGNHRSPAILLIDKNGEPLKSDNPRSDFFDTINDWCEVQQIPRTDMALFTQLIRHLNDMHGLSGDEAKEVYGEWAKAHPVVR